MWDAISLQPFSLSHGAGQVHLRVLGTTDLHVHVYPHDYFADRPAPGTGLAALAGVIAARRAEVPGSILLDSGDFLQGSPLGDYVAHERGFPDDAPHPMIAAMNATGYDAATLGNHEFNYGLDFLCRALRDATFPVVSANLVTRLGAGPPEDATLLPPFVLLERTLPDGAGRPHRLRIGVLGLLPPQVMAWDSAHLAGRVRVRDIVAAAEAWVPRIRAKGADLVIALAHTGIGPARAEPGMENASVPLAAIEGIDAVLAGHSHRVFPGPGHDGLESVDCAAGTLAGKPAAMGGALGSHLAVIDLLLDREGDRWRVSAHRAVAEPVATARAGNNGAPARVLRAAAADHAGALAYLRRRVGETQTPLQNYFSLIGPDPTLTLIADAQRAAVLRRLAGTGLEDLPVLSAVAPFRAGGLGGPANYVDIAPGPVSLRNVAELYPFPNALCALRVTGAILREWLEHAAGLFLTLRPGAADQPLIDPGFPGYNFDVLDGLTYTIDPGRPPRYDREGRLLHPGSERIGALCWQGRPVLPDQPFIVAVNAYRAGGGGNAPTSLAAARLFDLAQGVAEAISDHLRSAVPRDPSARPVWRLCPPPGMSALFRTGPRARSHLPLPHGPVLEDLGDDTDGFARFRLRF